MNFRRTVATVLATAAVTVLGTGVASAATPASPAAVSAATSAAAADTPFQLTNNSNLQLVVTRMSASCTNACPGLGYAIQPGATQTWAMPAGNSVSLDLQAKTPNSNVGGMGRVVFLHFANDVAMIHANPGASSGLRKTTINTSVTFTS